MKNTILALFRRLIPTGMQILVVAAILITAFLAYNLGAGKTSPSSDGSRAPGEMDSQSAQGEGRHPKDSDGDGIIYTCSMHPQVQQDQPGDCPICGMELVEQEVSGVTTATTGEHDHSAQQEPLGYACAMNCVPPLEEPGDCPICGMEMQPVFEESASSGGGDSTRQLSMSPEARALANIQTVAVERRPAEMPVRLDGQIGIDPTRRARISADTGGRIDALYADFSGQVVQKGQDLVLLYSPELLATQQDFLQARRAMERLPGEASASIANSSRRAVASARERLRLAGLDSAQIDAIAREGQARERVVLKAPIGGTVIDLHAQEGDYIQDEAPIITIADLSTVWGELEAYEKDLPWLRRNLPVTFTAESFPGEVFSGRIDWVDPVMNPSTRTTLVRVTIQNKEKKLKPGMYITGQAQSRLDQGPQPLIIPSSAPLITGKRAVVYVEKPQSERPTYEGREVILGPRTENGYVVKEGLREGERVVVNGAFQIDSALQIVAKPSMMSPEGEAPMPGHNHGGEMQAPQAESAEKSHAMGKLRPILKAYISLQTALAADKLESSQELFSELAEQAGEAQMASLAEAAKEGASSEDWDSARRTFQRVSNTLIALVKEQGNPLDSPLRLVHCPMAFDFEGADWLQTESEVRNPYFGDEMLKCGTVEQEFAAQ